MPRVKLPRKSTAIDMTAMCDVAFLLLSFFILTTKFKPSEALAVVTPSSVSSKAAESKDVVLVTIDPKGKVYFSVSDDAPKKEIFEAVNTSRNLGLTSGEIANLSSVNVPFIGVPFSQLKSLASKNKDEFKGVNWPGIPVLDTLNNELTDWVAAAVSAFQGQKMALQVKGDNDAKYPSFQAVIRAFKKNDQLKFQMITNAEGVPEGTELYKKNMSNMAAGKSASAE
ncbi:biopolymer transporter ExbD [Chitinophagaceae bacterium 26-R-25]|nr:biopolymer transporter ExbD [Chitinophagaceae bacterium 26-R-25]